MGRGQGQAEVRVTYLDPTLLRTILTAPLRRIPCPRLNSAAVAGVTGGELHISTHIL